jgi:hypothetical protein
MRGPPAAGPDPSGEDRNEKERLISSPLHTCAAPWHPVKEKRKKKV